MTFLFFVIIFLGITVFNVILALLPFPIDFLVGVPATIIIVATLLWLLQQTEGMDWSKVMQKQTRKSSRLSQEHLAGRRIVVSDEEETATDESTLHSSQSSSGRRSPVSRAQERDGERYEVVPTQEPSFLARLVIAEWKPSIDEISPDMPVAPEMNAGDAFNALRAHLFTDIFKGRASRSEYWWGWLFLTLAVMLLKGISGSVRGAPGNSSLTLANVLQCVLLVGVAFLWFTELGLRTRRAHDSYISGFWVGAAAVLQVVARIITVTSAISAVGEIRLSLLLSWATRPVEAIFAAWTSVNVGRLGFALTFELIAFFLWLVVACARPVPLAVAYKVPDSE